MTRYGYARVSTRGQMTDGNSLESQRKALLDAGAEEIVEEAYTGKTTHRPKFDELVGKLCDGDVLIVTKLDRMSRSVKEGLETIEQLRDKGISIHVLNMGIMDNSPQGRLIMNVMLAFAEFERDMIVTRTAEGKAVAKQREGYREGRPRVEVDPKKFSKNKKAVEAGKLTVREACAELGIGRTSWYNLCKSL